MRKFAILLVLAALTGPLASCDPGGPGAEGTISLDPEIDLADYRTLELRAFPDPGAGYDAASGAPAEGELFASSYDLADITFPYGYLIGGGVGTTDHQRWRILAWLSVSKQAFDHLPGSRYIFNEICLVPLPL